jgi:hypothetical protein
VHLAEEMFTKGVGGREGGSEVDQQEQNGKRDTGSGIVRGARGFSYTESHY